MFWALLRSITTIDTPGEITNWLEPCGHQASMAYQLLIPTYLIKRVLLILRTLAHSHTVCGGSCCKLGGGHAQWN